MNKYALDPYRVMTSHARSDVSDIIKQVLASPIKKEGAVREADGRISMEELSHSNTTVQTRIITQMAFNAIQGDVKSAEFLMKYGGYVLPEVREQTIDMPVIIDDVSNRLDPIPPSRLALEAAAEFEAAGAQALPAPELEKLAPEGFSGGELQLSSDL